MKIKSLNKTCGACPTQWEGTLEDGRMFYFRYRHGFLRITLSRQPTDNVDDAIDGIVLLEEEVGSSLDGWMSDRVAIGFMERAGMTTPVTERMSLLKTYLDQAIKHGLTFEFVYSIVNDIPTDELRSLCEIASMEWDI